MATPKHPPLLDDAAWLRAKYIDERLRMKDIGELVGCSAATVMQALRRHGIASRSPGFKHGHTSSLPGRKRESGTYRAWRDMWRRCTMPNHRQWDHYGGRGILVCEQWADFRIFLADMGERPEGLTLDRIDNDGNYEPRNCRWATYSQQNANRRAGRLHSVLKARIVEVDGTLMKPCNGCQRVLPLGDYARCSGRSDGLQANCRGCHREWYQARKALARV